MSSRFSAPLIGHEREPSYHFAALDAITDSARWDVRAEQARERYAPVYMEGLAELTAQFGMFRRGDSALIVVTYARAAATDTTALGVMDFEHVVVAAHDSSGTQIRMTRAPWRGIVVGVEQYDTQTHRARRARQWLAPPVVGTHAPALSTLFFYDGADTSTVALLPDALHRALTSDTLAGSRKLGVYWEVYPPVIGTDSTSRDSVMDVELTVTRIDGGILKWLAQAVHISQRDSPLAIHWHDTPGTAGASYRSVVLDLSHLPSGRYRVDLATGPDSTQRTVSSRTIELHEH